MGQNDDHNTPEIDPKLYSVLAILTPMGRIHATGFLIAPDLAVTCAHVLRDIYAGPGGSVRTRLAFERQTRYTIVAPEYWRPSLDIAFLRFTLELPPDAKPVRLASAQESVGCPVLAHGYPAGADGIWAEGDVAGIQKDFSAGHERSLLQIASHEITPSFSGSPIWDTRSGYVIGLITDIMTEDRYGSIGQITFATMADSLIELNADLKLQTIPEIHSDALPADTSAHDQQVPSPGNQTEGFPSEISTLEQAGDPDESVSIPDTEPLPSLFTIPTPPKLFIGREKQIVQLMRAFLPSDDPTRPIAAAISGVNNGSGIGKTALARVIATRLVGRFPDARMEIDLNGADKSGERPLTTEEAQRRLLRAFQRGRLPDRPQDLDRLYKETFSHKRALLLLDNAANANQVRPLLPPPPSGALITARKYFEIPEIGLEPVRLGGLTEPEAITLLRKRALRLVVESDPNVQELAERCGKVPLALQITGALLAEQKNVNVADYLAQQAGKRRQLLSRRHPDDPNIDVEAAIELSYQALDDDLKNRWNALAVFPEAFDEIGLEAIWGGKDIAALNTLLERRLIEYRAGVESYAIHPLLREYALDQLQNHDRGRAFHILMRHAEFALSQAHSVYKAYKYGKEHPTPTIQRLTGIWPDLAADWERLNGERDRWPQPSADSERQAAERWLSNVPQQVADLLELAFTKSEQRKLFQRGLQAARRIEDLPAQGFHLANLANIYAMLGQAETAIDLHKEHVQIARQLGDQRAEGNALAAIGTAYLALDDYHKAIEFHQQALEKKRLTSNNLGEATSLAALGLAHKNLNNLADARACWEAALTIYRANRSPRAIQVQTWLHSLES